MNRFRKDRLLPRRKGMTRRTGETIAAWRSQPTLKAAFRLLLGLAAVAVELCAASPAQYPYRMLISDMLTQKILILERDGSASWEYDQPGWVMDGELLPNGNVLYAWYEAKKPDHSGVREVTPDKKLVFEYKIPGECHSVQRLPDGLTLIADPTNQRLIEVDAQGRIARELRLQVTDKHVHRVTRQCRKLANGNYLVAQAGDAMAVEYAPDGRVLRRFPHSGQTYGVERLANGNTLIGTGGGPGASTGKSVLEFDPAGNVVWAFNSEDFPADTNLDWTLGVHRLPSGNTLIANFLGHGKDGKGTSILEVTPDKKVVWSYREPRIVLLVQLLP